MSQTPQHQESQLKQNDSQKQQNENNNEKKSQKTKSEAKQILLRDMEQAKKLLIEGQTQKASELAFKALLELKEPLGGEGSILLLPGYFILAEANILEDKLKKADQFLIAAYWNFLKYKKGEVKKEGNKIVQEDVTEDEYLQFRGTLHKTFAKLFLAQKEYQKALDELTNGIYMDSVKFGPESLITSSNYIQMGQIYDQKKDQTSADAFYGKYAKIWYKHMKRYFRQDEDVQSRNKIDDLMAKQALNDLQLIENYFEQSQEQNSMNQLQLIRTRYSLALLFKYYNEDNAFAQYLTKVAEDMKDLYGEEHNKYQKIQEILSQII